MVLNVRALRQRAPNHPAGPRYEAVARLLTGQASASIEDGVAWVRDLNWSLKIPPLRAYGVSRHDFPALAAQAAQSSSMKGNPIELTAAEMEEILELAWD
jgi:alcohol dehydrogenase class IV